MREKTKTVLMLPSFVNLQLNLWRTGETVAPLQIQGDPTSGLHVQISGICDTPCPFSLVLLWDLDFLFNILNGV